MAAKSIAAKAPKKTAVAKKATVHKAKAKGLQLTAAQFKTYQKAYSAAYQNIRLNNAARALRGRRIQAVARATQKYNSDKSKAQAASVASFAVSQSARQAGDAHQSAALRQQVNNDLRQHLGILKKAQYQQASESTYMQRAVQKTMTQASAKSYEEKAFKASSRISKAASKRGKTSRNSAKATAAAKTQAKQAGIRAALGTSTTATRGRGSVHATSAHQGGKTNRATSKGVSKQSAVAKSSAQTQKSSAKSKKAPVKQAKGRTAPAYMGDGAWDSVIHDTGPQAVRFTPYGGWLGDETSSDCVITALRNHLLLTKRIELVEVERRLLKQAIQYTQIQRALPDNGVHILSALIAARDRVFSTRLCLKNFYPATPSTVTPGMVVGYETPNGPHAALLLTGTNRVACWGGEYPLTVPVDEAWILEWVVYGESQPG